MFCDRCQIDIKPHTNNRSIDHPFYEEQDSYYGRICPHCGKSIKIDFKPQFVVERENKLKYLREKVRKAIRRRLDT